MLFGHHPLSMTWYVEKGLDIRFVAKLFPITPPHLDCFDVALKVGCVAARIFLKRSHSLAVQRVRFLVAIAFLAAVKVAAVELVSRMRFRTPSVDRKFPNSLLPSVDLMADRASVLSGLPC